MSLSKNELREVMHDELQTMVDNLLKGLKEIIREEQERRSKNLQDAIDDIQSWRDEINKNIPK